MTEQRASETLPRRAPSRPRPRAGARARELGPLRLRQHDFLDEHRDALFPGVDRGGARCFGDRPALSPRARPSLVVLFAGAVLRRAFRRLAPAQAVGRRIHPGVRGGDRSLWARSPARRSLPDALLFCSPRSSSPTSPTSSRSPRTTRCSPSSCRPSRHGRLSGLGTALGYVGSIAGVLLVAPFVSGAWAPGRRPPGRVPADGRLFLLFSLPFFFFCATMCRDRGRGGGRRSARSPRKIAAGFREARKYPGLRRFLFASYLYQDALGTAIAFMALYAVKVLGLRQGRDPALRRADPSGDRRLVPRRVRIRPDGPAPHAPYRALGMDRRPRRDRPRSRALGFLGRRRPARASSFGGIWVGGAAAFLTLVPASEAGRFFGLLSLSARAAAIVGPLIWAASRTASRRPFGNARIPNRRRVAVLFMAVRDRLLRGVPDAAKSGVDCGRGRTART